MIRELLSPPIEDHGPVPSDFETAIGLIADDAVRDPGYVESGRLTRRVILGENSEEYPLLHEVAVHLGREYLGLELAQGSLALVSVVTDAEKYNDQTRGMKAASNWHQDFVDTGRGFFFPPANRSRLIIPGMVGPICIRGQIGLAEGVTIPEANEPGLLDRNASLQAGPTVFGADGVLLKSEADPLRGEIYETTPDRVYGLPIPTVHKAPPALPEGRIFFQMDALGEEL